MRFPESLTPTATIAFQISDRLTISVPKVIAAFRPWMGSPVSDDCGGKPILDCAGEPLFAELVVLRQFQAAGWQGVWMDTYHRRTRTGITEDVSLPDERRALLTRITNRAGIPHGCFDVFAWRDDVVVFAETKRAGRDRIRPSQIRWLSAALDVGVPLDSLLVVEWSLDRG